MFNARDPHSYIGQVVGNGHCVPFVQAAAGAPHTSQWRRGASVAHGEVPPVGTVVATFSDAGRYENDTTGRSHAAIFLSRHDTGIEVIDCWVGQPVHQRTIRFRGGQGLKVNDADQFFVVEAGSDLA